LQRASRRSRQGLEEPLDIEEMDLIYGVPKIVFVILADVIALFGFFGAVWTVTNLAKKKQGDEW